MPPEERTEPPAFPTDYANEELRGASAGGTDAFLADKQAKSEHSRRQWRENILNVIIIILLMAVGGVALTGIVHMGMSEKYAWLSDSQMRRIEGILIGAFTTWWGATFGNRWFSGKS